MASTARASTSSARPPAATRSSRSATFITRSADRAIFSGLNLSIPRGRITAIMGPSGTGKTTLLRLITGQIKPDRGQVLFDGIDVSQL